MNPLVMMMQYEVTPNAPAWPLWPFLVLVGVLVLPGVSVILLGVLAWIKAPQREAIQERASEDTDVKSAD